jgi:hypothetical protein
MNKRNMLRYKIKIIIKKAKKIFKLNNINKIIIFLINNKEKAQKICLEVHKIIQLKMELNKKTIIVNRKINLLLIMKII